MKITWAMLGMLMCFVVGLVVSQGTANARELNAPQQAEEMGSKKCSFQSDCPYGTCKSGQCGGCSFQSDCKGWGTCKSGQCGGCSFQSDCKGFGACNSGMCEKSPY
jgi:hypothetical protein